MKASFNRKVGSLERQISTLSRENALLEKNIEMRNDALQNSFASLISGAANQSALGSFSNLAYYNIYAPLTINWTLLTYMYKTHGILQAAIDMPVLDALRGGVEIHSDELSTDDIKDLQDLIEQGGILSTIGEAMVWTRLYGGGAIIVNTPQKSDQPLNTKNLDKIELYAANRWEIVSPRRYAEFYDFYGNRLHKSRVLTLGGKAAPYLVRWTLQGWGMSEMERMIEDFNLYLRTKDVIYELLREAKIDVYQFENFTAQLATQRGTQQVQNRVSIMNMAKSYQNAVIMDAKDKFEQKQITFAGLAEVMKQNQMFISSSVRIPMTKLFGMSASGFNSGEDDIENYNAMIESEVREPLRPVLRDVIGLLCIQLFDYKPDFSFSYKPLRIMSSLDEETVATQKSARFTQLYSLGLLTAQETMGLMHSEKLIPIETEVAKGAEPEPPNAAMEDVEGDDSEKEIKKDDESPKDQA
jgi:phage-related protein (TIGR01555 family)